MSDSSRAANSESPLTTLEALSVIVSADVEKLLSGVIAGSGGRKFAVRTGQGTAVGLDCKTRDGLAVGKCLVSINENLPQPDGQLLKVDIALVELKREFDIQNVITVDGEQRQLRLGKGKLTKDVNVFVACGNGEIHDAVVHNECMGVERFSGAIAVATRDSVQPSSVLGGDNCGALVVSLPEGSSRTALVHGIIIGRHEYEGANGLASMDVAMPLWEALQAACLAVKLEGLFTESELASVDFYDRHGGNRTLPPSLEPAKEFARKRAKLCEKIDIEYGLLSLLQDKGVITKNDVRTIGKQSTSSDKVLELLETLDTNEYQKLNEFVEALHQTNQSHVVDILLSDEWPLASSSPSGDQTNVSLSMRRACQRSMKSQAGASNLDDVLTQLVEQNVLVDDHVRAISSKPKTERVALLFDILQRRPESDFSKVCEAFGRAGFSDVLDISLLMKSPDADDKRELNILLMGETGSGKSTLINAFAIYQLFATILEAETQDLCSIWPIPIQIYVDGKEALQTGSDDNEWHGGVGESSTQRPTVYRFENGNQVVNIIDSPGLLDIKGHDQDRKHVHNILTLLETVKYVNAICIVVNSTTNRLTSNLQYCLKEILSNMDESARANVVFCQTFANSNRRLGDELTPILKKFIEKCGLQIEVTDETVYRFDNQPIRYLAAKKLRQNHVDSPEERMEVGRLWKMSKESTEKLLDHVSQLPQLPVLHIASIYKAKRAILVTSSFAFDVACNIARDISDLSEKSAAIDKTIDRLTPDPVASAIADVLHMFITFRWLKRIIRVSSERFMTVCTSHKCATVKDGAVKYAQVCHNNCTYIKGVDSMYWCSAFDKHGKCKECGCNYKLHEWKISRTEVVEMELFQRDELMRAIEDNRDNPDEQLKVLKKYAICLKKHCKQLECEQVAIIETCARLSLFVKHHAMLDDLKELDFDRVLDRQLDAIAAERRDDERAVRTENVLAILSADYKTKWDALKDEQPCDPQDVEQLINSLYILPLKGSEMKEAAEAADRALCDGITETRRKTVWKNLRPAKAWRFLKSVHPISLGADLLQSIGLR